MRLWEEMVELARRLFHRVRCEEGFFLTGVCEVKGETWLLINTHQPLPERIFTLANILVNRGLETIYIKPRLREKLMGLMEGKNNLPSQ